jgi:predicted dithiol-disulfide oxidoreductase (DUF899 family)
MSHHRTATREQWREERLKLLEAEKQHFRRGDEIARMRRELPWVALEKEYVFDTEAGPRSLAELFEGDSQLLVYHFMFGFGARLTEERQGCTGCSFVADHFDAVIPHLRSRGVRLVCASIAPLRELCEYRREMGWTFPWHSSLGSDFSYDFGAAFSEQQQRDGAEYNYAHVDHPLPQREGMSAFALQDGVVHHTYSTYARGTESLMGTYPVIDLAPLGRNEAGIQPGDLGWRRHDEYDLG